MRIISGKYKGRHISPPKNFKARPTTDFAREGIFNILENNFDIEGMRVLDLFSGTGSVSFEFASRGCEYAELYEINRIHFGFIIKTMKELGFQDIIRAHQKDVFRSIPKIKGQFDIIFADPPFNHPDLDKVPSLVLENDLLAENGWMIMEHPGKHDFSSHPRFFKYRNYGSVNFSIFF